MIGDILGNYRLFYKNKIFKMHNKKNNSFLKKKIAIIGAGWYGVHIALILKKECPSCKATLFEKILIYLAKFRESLALDYTAAFIIPDLK